MKVLVFLLSIYVCIGVCENAQCSELIKLKRLSLKSSTALVNNKKLIFKYPDSNENPKVWEGPIEVMNTKDMEKCLINVSLVTDAYVSNNNVLITKSYSGSMKYLNFYNLNTCKSLRSEEEFVSDQVKAKSNLITIMPYCYKVSNECFCYSGKVFSVQKDGSVKLLEKALESKTLKVTGKKFSGFLKVKCKADI